MRLSIIIPALNEADGIQTALSELQELRRRGHELILVDGGSADATLERASGLVDTLLTAPRGRASQMNAGASVARGDVVLFLHADTRLPEDPARLVLGELARTGRHWGRFDVRIAGNSPMLRLVGWMMNQRSRLTGIATGDQAMFVRRSVFMQAGGFPTIALMEDIVLSAELKRRSRPVCLRDKAVTSGRRWEKNGLFRTILLMWWLRLRFFLGASPDALARRYQMPPS
jgi:rSAM/selenodomain-associated transferase 2